jgi:serine/threonine protein phosphatase PrpC
VSQVVANLGDSRAVLSRNGVAQDMSEAQSPNRVDEKARIEAANGWITVERELMMSRLHQMDLSDPSIREQAEKRVKWVEIARVNGELAVARAIGDADYKGDAKDKYCWAYPEGHSEHFTADLVSSEPEFKETELTADDEFLVLACDGVWDVLESQEVIDQIYQDLSKGRSAQEAAENLAHQALRLGSSDNVTAIVICFAEPASMHTRSPGRRHGGGAGGGGSSHGSQGGSSAHGGSRSREGSFNSFGGGSLQSGSHHGSYGGMGGLGGMGSLSVGSFGGTGASPGLGGLGGLGSLGGGRF